MLSSWQNLLVVIAVVAFTLGCLLLINRLWPRENRRLHNDMVGWQLSIVGTIYAVILGFMLYTVWSAYTVADINVDQEANAIADLFRIASGLPSPQRERLQEEARQYAQLVLEQDWPEMERSLIPEKSGDVTGQMWGTIWSVRAASPSELSAVDHALEQVTALNEHRRNRVLQSQSHLPGVLWCVLIAGGCMTVLSACLFGGSSNLLHVFQVCSLALLISLVLVAIADIYRPFQGGVHVSSNAFERAQQNMRER